ncbi:MAG: hypothetical protein ABJE10_05765, partial [bacterium]
MNERRRPPRRKRGPRPNGPDTDNGGEDNPYREASASEENGAEPPERGAATDTQPEPVSRPAPPPPPREVESPAPSDNAGGDTPIAAAAAPAATPSAPAPGGPPPERTRPEGGFGGSHPREQHGQNGRRGRRNRGRGRRDPGTATTGERPIQGGPPAPIVLVPTGETVGWFDPARDGGFIRRAHSSYLADSGDAYVPPHIVRQYTLRKSDEVRGTTGRDQRGRTALIDVTEINGSAPADAGRRPEFNTLIATYPERKLSLETGRPAKAGNELIRRAIDLIAPIGYGQRALIVAPARAGKTTLLHAITEGIALNHPEASLLILLVDERPEEV